MEKCTFPNIIKETWNDFHAAYSLTKALQISIFLFLVLFYLDLKDIPSRLISMLYEFPLTVSLITGVCILLFLLAWAIRSVHIITLIKFRLFTLFDFASFVFFIALLIYDIIRFTMKGRGCIFTSSCVLTIVSFGFVACRHIYLCTVKKKALLCQPNLVDLKDLACNQFSVTPNAPIQIAEKDVSYDLLHREIIIDQLLQAIIFCKPDTSYVISLEGPWGSGKTTVLNSVKDQLRSDSTYKNEIILIDDFDPWLYGNQNALLAAMYNKIISAMGLKFDPLHSEHFLKRIMNACASDAAAKFQVEHIVESLFYGNQSEEKCISELKRKISTYLLNSGKRFVFIIDNLDRTNDENIVFLFKLISIVFDFPGVIYVLSFERKRINAILKQTHELDHRFLEKIIQQQIIVPPISKEQSQELYEVCMFNLLHAYGVSRSDAEQCSTVFDYIIKHTDNLRNFKRILNSVFPVVFCRYTPLNLHELFSIEAIHFLEPELYYRIHNNSQYFISEGKKFKERFILSKDKFNAAGKELFSNIEQEFPNCMSLLADIFPYAKRYVSNQPLEPDYPYQNPDYKDIVKKACICHELYFDLYFTATTNSHSNISESVRSFVSVINSGATSTFLQQALSEELLSLDYVRQKEWVENLQFYINDIDSTQAYSLASVLTAIYCKINNCRFFVELSAMERVAYIITVLLSKCSPAEIDNYVVRLEHSYQYLELLYSLCYWLNSSKTDENIKEILLPQFKQYYYEMCEEVLNNKIDIFDDTYYLVHNSWGLLSYLESEKKQKIGQHYYQAIMSARNIYRILWDFTGCSVSNEFSYYINEKNLADYIDNNDLISKCLQKSTTRTKSEEFIKQIYDQYLEGEKDYSGRPIGVTSKVEKLPQL